MKRSNLVRDKYNIGMGTAYLHATTRGWTQDTADGNGTIPRINTISNSYLRWHWGCAGRTKATGRRWAKRRYDWRGRSLLIRFNRECANAQAWLAAQKTLAHAFATSVYCDGLRDQYDKIETRGASVELPPVKAKAAINLLVFESAGRRLFTIEDLDDGAFCVTFICASGEPGHAGMAIQSDGGASIDEVKALLDRVILSWQMHHPLLQANSSVGLC